MNRNVKWLLLIPAIILLGYFLWNISSVIIYFFTALVLALVGRSLTVRLNQIKLGKYAMPSWLSSLLVLLLYVIVILGIVSLLVPIINKEIQVISAIDVDALMYRNQDLIYTVEGWLEKLNFKQTNINDIKQKLTDYFNFEFVSNLATTVVSKLGSIFAGIFSVLFITFFLLKDEMLLNNMVVTLVPDKYLPAVNRILAETRDLLSRYFTGILIQVTIVTAIVWAGMSIFSIANALLLGIIAGLLNIVPYIGPIISACIGILLGITANLHLNIQTEMLPLVLKMAGVYAAAQLTDNLVLQPLIFSKSVKAHPLEIFFVILIAGTLTGILGMILAVPVYTFLKIIAKEFFQGYKLVRGLTSGI